MMTAARLTVLVCLGYCLALAGCSRPGEERCTQVCEHYLDLYIASEFAAELESAADDTARAEIEMRRAKEREAMRGDPDRGFEQCVNRCNRRARGEVADCVMNAETLDAAKACEPSDSACSAGPGSPTTPAAIIFGLLAVFGLGTRRRRTLA